MMSDNIKKILIDLKEHVGLTDDILFDINECNLVIFTGNYDKFSQDLVKEFIKKNKKLLLSCGVKEVNVHNCYKL